jgi:hypothetical protein
MVLPTLYFCSQQILGRGDLAVRLLACPGGEEPIFTPVPPRVNLLDRKLAPDKGEGYPGYNAESEPVGGRAGSKTQPPPNKLMNGPVPQQYRSVGRREHPGC